MIDFPREVTNKILDELYRQNEKEIFTQKVEDNTFNLVESMKKMQEFFEDNTQVLLCSPVMKKKILDLSIPMCEVIASTAIPDGQVYMITDDKVRKDFLNMIRGTDTMTWCYGGLEL